MHRCLVTVSALLALATPVFAHAQELVQRNFPAHALRGELVVGVAPEAHLNGKPARLSPGARIRGTNNLLLVPTAVTGQKLAVHYTVEHLGLIHEVWVLRPDELAKRWPKTAKEASQWVFDPVAQVWAKP